MKKIVCSLMCLVLLASCSARPTSRTEFLMDTVCKIDIYSGSDKTEDAFILCRELENMLSRTKATSDIYKINSGKSEVNPETAKLVEKALKYSEISDGRFDISVCSASELWDFNEGKIPQDKAISAVLEKIDYKRIKVDGNTVDSGGTKIDLGGIAKGYICDEVTAFLREKGTTEAIINFGGNVSIIGNNGGKGYNIGIAKPFSSDVVATVVLSDTSAVTSGVYQRYIEEDGKLYHHILDPKTGKSADTDLLSVTVISKSSADADALSTVCMLLGLKEGMELIESIPDTEAFFIDRSYNLSHTSGLEKSSNVWKCKEK